MQLITLTHGETMLTTPSAALALQVLSGLTEVSPVISRTASSMPAIGTYWLGQGGINGGYVAERGDVPAHYLIFSDKDAGKREWGGRSKQSGATSKTDGLANTGALLEEGDHPAAELADQFTADGHTDFYLPATAELYQGWLNCPEIFSTSDWYWSSSQRSAYSAFSMDFEDGSQDDFGKDNECFVRPVRRLFI